MVAGQNWIGWTVKPYRTNLATLCCAISVLFVGCGNDCGDAYDAGYAAGMVAGSSRHDGIAQGAQSSQECPPDPATSAQPRTGWNAGPTSTEVCGGGGVDVGTDHIEPGDSGCVRVFGDGRIKRYRTS